jgi:hypothetical protein
MKCNKAHKWIALHREGELEPGIQKKLLEHLATCESCNQLCQAYKQNDQLAAQIRSQRPEPDNENILTGRILNAVADIKKTAGETGVMAMIDRFFDFIMLPLIHRVALACILIITVSFGYQQYYIYSRTALLEDQLAAAGKTFLAKVQKAGMEDCIHKSARYLSRIKAGQGETEKNLRKYFRENPEKLNLYASLLCNRQYRSLKKYVNQDNFMVQDIFSNYKSETE